MAREDRETYDQRQTRLRNEFNKQKARKAASAASEAAAAADRQRQWMEQQLHEMRMSQAQASTIDSIPGQFANPIQTVQPPAPRFEDPRMGGGTGAVNRDVMGITASDTIGNIDWNVTPWFIDKQTGAMRVLPANNNKEGFMGFGGGVGRETGMTDEEFKLAWAQQYAMGKEMPSGWSTALGRGTDAPSEAQALKILLDRGADTGVLESEAQKRSRREKAAGKVTSSVREFAPKIDPQGTKGTPPIQAALGGVRDMFGFLGGPEGGSRNQRISSGIPGSPNTYAAPIEDIDPSVRALTPEQIYDMEMDDPTRSGPITPMMALTPEQQFEQQLQAEAAATAAAPAAPAALTTAEQMELAMQGVSGRSAIGDAQRAQRAGEGGMTDAGGSTAAQANLQGGAWTPEMWRAAGYTQMPDGSWDIVSPPSPAPALAPADVVPPGPGEGVPISGSPSATVSPEVPRIVADTTPPAPVVTTVPTGPGEGIPISGSPSATVPTADSMAATMGTAATPAVSDMFANVAQTGAPLWQAAQDPFQQYQRYRMAQAGGAPIGTLTSAAGQQALRSGYQPAYGRFLLGGTQLGLDDGWQQGGEGEAFGRYLAGGQRKDLGDIRSLYGGLGSYLGSLGTATDVSQLSLPYANVFGTEPRREDVLSATQAALGMGGGMGQRSYRNLGNIYDLMQTQYGPQGAGRFADWVGTAFQPQQQQQQIQQPANGGPSWQNLGTQTLKTPEQQWEEAYQGVQF